VSATVGERGGGAAPAQRHNRSPAHGKDRRATYRDVLVERSGAASGEPAAGSGPTGPATEGERGGGAAPAQRRNLSPARGNGPTTFRSEVERSGAASGEPAAGSGPTGPATGGRRGGGAAPAQRRNLSPARGNGPTTFRSEMAARGGTFSGELAASGEPTNSKYHSLPAYGTEPYQHTPAPHTPTDHEEIPTPPVLSPSARNRGEAPEENFGHFMHRLETGQIGKSTLPPQRQGKTGTACLAPSDRARNVRSSGGAK
jgi:hypothetical protein